MDVHGISECLRYAFPPNSLHYCGPEKQADIKGYLKTHTQDKGLHGILSRFETLYPYLQLIAGANHIQDPFDRRVVESYWIGNRLLANIPKRDFHTHLTESLKIHKKFPKQGSGVMDGIMSFGLPHHTFHVLTIYVRTGHVAIAHTLHTMDSCRIGWGTVISGDAKKGTYVVSMPHLAFDDPASPSRFAESRRTGRQQLTMNNPTPTLVHSVDGVYVPGDLVSVHWGYICGKLTLRQKRNLEHFTAQAVVSANSLRSLGHIV
jgi:hypothetical protein